MHQQVFRKISELSWQQNWYDLSGLHNLASRKRSLLMVHRKHNLDITTLMNLRSLFCENVKDKIRSTCSIADYRTHLSMLEHVLMSLSESEDPDISDQPENRSGHLLLLLLPVSVALLTALTWILVLQGSAA